ncbi:MAG: FtsQ-type POTRA domain-containing protein [Acidimicrobiales bacterium]|nr:FtsQ-type POTRA domain-containing protein [Acidimicrobiales bacterium]
MTTGTLSRSNRSRPGAPSALIDPRLRARRIEVERGRGRKRLRRLVALVAVVVLAAAGYGFTRTALLDVDHVRITGVDGERAAEVVRAGAVARGSAMVDLDTAAVDRRVSALPWVLNTTVERRWPGTVAIAVTTRRPVAVDVAGSALDASGRSFGPVDGAAARLPVLRGAAVEVGHDLPADRHPVLAVLAGLPAEMVGEVESAVLVDGDVELELIDGIDVRFGPAERHRAKFRALAALLDQADRATIRSIDVRVPTSPSLTRRTGTGA